MCGEKSNIERHIPVLISYLRVSLTSLSLLKEHSWGYCTMKVLSADYQVILGSNFRIKFETTLSLAIPFAINTSSDCLCQLLLGYYAPLTCRKCVLYNQRPNWKTKRNKPFDNLASQYGTVFSHSISRCRS